MDQHTRLEPVLGECVKQDFGEDVAEALQEVATAGHDLFVAIGRQVR